MLRKIVHPTPIISTFFNVLNCYVMDIIKWISVAGMYNEYVLFFFSEMAERHKSKQVLKIARDLIHKLQTLIENK